MSKDKKLEILFIEDIKSLNNKLLSRRTNHYLQNFLFTSRLVFRYNFEDLDDLIDLYYYVEDILKEDILVDMDELKILIYRFTDFNINMDDYAFKGDTILTETIANLLFSLYLELETYKLVDKTDEDDIWRESIVNQLRNQVVDFDILINLLESASENDVKEGVLSILKNNYPFEYAVYNARNGYLEW